MKRILLLTMTAAAVTGTQICFAQRPLEPESPPLGVAAPAPGQPAVRSANRRPATPAAVAPPNAFTTFSSSSKGDSIPPVMIRFSESDAKASAGLEEDLYVMARVISRTLERAEGDRVITKMNVPMLLTGSGRSVRPMYIEGLGPLFMIKVSFPLIPMPKVEEKKNPKKRGADTEWEDSRNEVFPNVEAWVDDSDQGSNYNDEQVELLKKELVGALKLATNMRGLKPDEFVNISVFGYAPPVRIKALLTPSGADPGIGLPARNVVVFDKGGAANAVKGSVLTMRAKKSDIDSFASGSLDADAFKAKVTMATYFGSGVGSSSINSWIQEKANAR
jgi:hypothetical protein